MCRVVNGRILLFQVQLVVDANIVLLFIVLCVYCVCVCVCVCARARESACMPL